MFVSSQNSYVEILIPKVMVLGHGAFEGGLGQKNGAFMSGINVLVQRPQRAPLSLMPCEDAVKRQLSMN